VKRKITRILGAGLIVALLASLMLAAVPVAANPGTDAWSTKAVPLAGALGGDFWDNTIVQVGPITKSIDGTLYTYVDKAGTDNIMWSTDGGRTWAESTSTTLSYTAVGGTDIVDIACSPGDAATLYVATNNATSATTLKVYKSADAGQTFTDITYTGIAAAEIVTGIDVGYISGDPYVFIGTQTGARGGGVYFLKDTPPAFGVAPLWTDMVAGTVDVWDIACAPDFSTSQQLVAVVSEAATSAHVYFYYGATGWNVSVPKSALYAAGTAPTAANIALPDNYDSTAGSANLEFLVAIDDAGGTNGGVYRLVGNFAVEYLNTANAAALDCVSVDIAGNVGYYTALAGTDAGVVYYSTDGAGTLWTSTAVVGKEPSGNGNCSIVMADDFGTSGQAWAAVTGADQAISLSTNGGINWNQISLIDSDIATVDDMVISNGNTYMVATDAGGVQSLWKNDGTYWERVFVNSLAACTTGQVDLVAVSPAGDAVFIADTTGGLGIYRSLDDGTTFTALVNIPAAINGWVVIDKNTIISGGVAVTYKTTNNGALPWVLSSQDPTNTVVDIVLSPNFATDSTILLGNNNSQVWLSTDAGTNWGLAAVGAVASTAVGNTYVAFDPNYATNSIVYAAADDQVDSFVIGIPVLQTTLLSVAVTGAPLVGATTFSGIVCAADGTLYVAAGDGSVTGVMRSLYPSGTDVEAIALGLANAETLAEWEQANATEAGNIPAAVAALNSLQLTNGNVLWGPAGADIWTYTDTLAVQVSLLSPTDGAAEATTNSAILEWTGLTGVTNYDIDVCPRADFAAGTLVVPGTYLAGETTATYVGLTAGLTYYWRVRVNTGTPVLSRFSEVRAFTTALNVPAAAPVLAPASGAQDIILSPAFGWGAVAGATSYELELATLADFSDAVSQTTTLNAYLWPEELEYSTAYFWRVRAITATGQSGWVNGIFTTEAAPVEALPPVVIEPTPVVPAPIVEITEVTPAWIWGVIGIGAVLVIAVIILIVRTRRVV